MERYDPEKKDDIMSEELRELTAELSTVAGEEILVEFVDGTYEIEAEHFTLTFTIEDSIFTIRSITVRGKSGLGRQIVTTIHEFADTYDLTVTASKVRSTAVGFWESMGYEEAHNDNTGFMEFIRVA